MSVEIAENAEHQRIADDRLPGVLITLMKGATWRDSDPAMWQSILLLQSRARDYVSVLGLELILDEEEGYAYLRQRPQIEGAPPLPRLVQRRQLSYPVSLLLALLRRKLAEFDARGGETRLVLGADDMVELMRVFLADTANEARLVQKIDAHIQKIVDLGFLRRLKGQDDRYEVRRILKAFVDGQWLQEFDQRLMAYRAEAVAETGSDGNQGTESEGS